MCGNGTCHSRLGGHLCVCDKGATNYGSQEAKCISEHKLFDSFNHIHLMRTVIKKIICGSSDLDCDLFNHDLEQQVRTHLQPFNAIQASGNFEYIIFVLIE